MNVSRDGGGMSGSMMNDARLHQHVHSGDFDILVDDDGTGYMIYSQHYSMSIERLTPDFYYSTGQSYMFDEYFVEAPVFFKRNRLYYAIFGWCCCYCMQGSGAIVHSAVHPMGPYMPTGDLACTTKDHANSSRSVKGLPTPDQGCEYHDARTTSIVRSQQNYIVKVTNGSGYTTFVWTGDR